MVECLEDLDLRNILLDLEAQDGVVDAPVDSFEKNAKCQRNKKESVSEKERERIPCSLSVRVQGDHPSDKRPRSHTKR